MKLFNILSGKKRTAGGCAAVIVAAGSSSRMGGIDKLTASLRGERLIAHTLRAFESCSDISEIVLVTREDRLDEMSEIAVSAGIKKLRCVAIGGSTRAESSLAGVMAVSENVPLVAIHDGARPLVTGKVISAAVKKAAVTGAAIPVIPMTDTLKRADCGVITESVERSGTYRVQTPQVFDRDVIKAALTKALRDGAELTDDSSAVQLLGGSVSITEGSPENIKVTTPEDLVYAEAVLEGRMGK